MNFNIECEQEEDGRWIAEVPDLPGVPAYGETRPHRTARGHERGGHARELFTCQRLFTGNPQEEFPISNVKLSGQNHKF